jgi:hypothetical protein
MSKPLTPLQALKASHHGKRFYVAARRFAHGSIYFRAELAPVGTPEDLATARKYFKAQHRGTYDEPNTLFDAVCYVSRYGNVSWGCYIEVPEEA